MYIILIIISIISLDQLTKLLVVNTMSENQTIGFIKGLMDFTYKKNTGVAFGMLSEHRWLFMSFTAIMLIAMVVFLIKYKSTHRLVRIAVAFLIGGGAGNMIDRLFRLDTDGSKFVVDFFEFTFVDFAIFNVADCFVTFGAVLLVIYVAFYEKHYPIFGVAKPDQIENEIEPEVDEQ